MNQTIAIAEIKRRNGTVEVVAVPVRLHSTTTPGQCGIIIQALLDEDGEREHIIGIRFADRLTLHGEIEFA